MGKEDAAIAVTAHDRPAGIERLPPDTATDQPLRCRLRPRLAPPAVEVARRRRPEPGADIGEGQSAPEQEVDRGSIVVGIEGVEVDPVTIVALPGDQLRQSRGPQDRVGAGRRLVIADISPAGGDLLERHALDGIEIGAAPVIRHRVGAARNRRRWR